MTPDHDSGERQGDREAIDRVAKRIIEHGGFSAEEAQRRAVESMRRVDRMQRERGKR